MPNTGSGFGYALRKTGEYLSRVTGFDDFDNPEKSTRRRLSAATIALGAGAVLDLLNADPAQLLGYGASGGFFSYAVGDKFPEYIKKGMQKLGPKSALIPGAFLLGGLLTDLGSNADDAAAFAYFGAGLFGAEMVRAYDDTDATPNVGTGQVVGNEPAAGAQMGPSSANPASGAADDIDALLNYRW